MSTIKNVAGTNAALSATGIKPYSEGTKKLQQELNKHIDQGHLSGPRLKEDGKEGPRTRAKMHEFQNYTKAQQCEPGTAVVPVKPTLPPAVAQGTAKPALPSDTVETKYPTVGEYVDDQIKKVGQELKEDAQVAAVTAVAAPVVAVIEARHLNQARERIAKLPMDPDGKWKQEASKIFAEEQAAAKKEIIAIPGKVADGVVDAAVAVKDGVVDGAIAVKDGVVDAAEAVADGVSDAAHAVGNAVDAFGDKITEMASDLKDDAQVIAVTAIAPIPVAIIQGKHLEQARERIAALPMDPEGKWKQAASKILSEERAEAKAEILALPGKVVDGVVDGAIAVKDGVVDAAEAVADGVSDAATAVGNTVVKSYKIAEFAVEEAVDDVKDFAGDVADGVGKGVKEARQGVGGFFQRVGKWISGD
ncbi:MAG TPA: hypothetical protein V6D00_14880 [Pantanalinema sp.]